MIIIPAIDILNGNCVRLVKGEYDSAHKVATDALETALEFVNDGATYIHMVDLNGAKDGKKVNHKLFCEIASKINVPIELGGGIRDMDTISYYIENGIEKVILGSAALKNPELVKIAVNEYREHIAVGIDAKDGFVSISGWTEDSKVQYLEFAKIMESYGVQNIIFTDINRDGTLEGPNLDQLQLLKNTVKIDITASGGIKNMENIKALAKMDLYGVICGKSIYSGSLSLKEAVCYGDTKL